MVFVWILCAALILLLIAFAAAAVFFFRIALCRQKPHDQGVITTSRMEGRDPWVQHADKIKAACEWMRSQQFKRESIVSFDGLELSARFLPAPDAVGTVILMHGFHSSCDNDFACILPFYHENGYNILLPDQRAHGQSGGKYITFGVKESRDCLEWARFIEGKYGGDIFLHGISMGGSTVLFCGGLPLPAGVRGIIDDCGFTSPEEIFRHVLKTAFRLPAFPLMNIEAFLIKSIAGFSPDEVSGPEMMARCKVPVLFVHGTEDKFVPIEMGKRNYDACTAYKRAIWTEGAGHGMSYLTDPERCITELTAFLRHCGSVRAAENAGAAAPREDK